MKQVANKRNMATSIPKSKPDEPNLMIIFFNQVITSKNTILNSFAVSILYTNGI